MADILDKVRRGLKRLRNIRVRELSIVDDGANNREFLVIKRRDGMADLDQDTATTDDLDNDFDDADDFVDFNSDDLDAEIAAMASDADAADADAANGDDADADASNSDDAGDKDDGDESTQKAKHGLPGPVKTAALRMLMQAMERLTSLINDLKGRPEMERERGAPLPPDIGKSMKQIMQMLASVTEKYPSPGSGHKEDMEKSATDFLTEAQGRLVSAITRSTVEKSANVGPNLMREVQKVQLLLANAGASRKPPSEGGDDVSDEPTIPKEQRAEFEKIRKEHQDLAKENEEIKKRLGGEVDRRLIKESVDHIRATYKNLPRSDPEKLGAVFKRLKEKAPKELALIEEVLKAADTAIGEGNAFGEIGSGHPGESDDTAYGELKRLANELVEKSGGEMSSAQARVKIMAIKPELYNQHRAERGGQ